MLHHPCMFRLDTTKKVYISKSSLNASVRLDAAALIFPYTLAHYHELQCKLHSNREFVIFLVFKLLERGVYISARNVAVLESSSISSRESQDTDDLCEETVDENKSLRSQTRSSVGQRSPCEGKIVHCDVIAFNAKKRHVYVIVVCDHVSRFPQCRLHALRVANSITHIIPEFSIVVPCVLTVYNFQLAGSMRLCPVTVTGESSHRTVPGKCVKLPHTRIRKKPRLS